jgi:hypothetical protein
MLSFDTSGIPAGATILSADRELTRGGLRGTNPFTIFGNLNVDIKSGGFNGNTAVQHADFQAPADAANVVIMSVVTGSGQVSTGSISVAGLAFGNTGATTQFRRAFDIDDDNDGADDHVGFHSSNNTDANRHPRLVVTYQP